MIISRPSYMQKLISGMGSDQVKVVTGIRRCGKSFLVFNLFKDYLLKRGIPKANIIEMAFDRFSNRRYRDTETFYSHVTEELGKTSGKRYVLLDEVQLLDSFPEVLMDLIAMPDVLSSAIGSLVNPSKISATFRSEKNTTIAPETVDRYLSHLEDAFLVSRAKRYDLKGRRYIGTPFKLYFSDLGLRNARMNFRQMEGSHIMENVIYNELRGRGFGVDVGVVPTGVRGKDGKVCRTQLEVDF